MSTSLPYLHLDVFTSEPLLGNQLAVFTDARGLSADLMQRLTREMNYSESTFILPAERSDTDIRMRIFAPGVEMPVAGHPTIGSTFALAHAGVIKAGTPRFVFGLNVGPTVVDLEWDGNRLHRAWMTQGRPVFGATMNDRAAAARALSLTTDDIHSALPIQEVSCGVPFLYVPLRDRGAVDRAACDLAAFRALPGLSPERPALFAFAAEPGGAYSRMFAPHFGIVEDPATGIASGPLGSYLVSHGCVTGPGPHRIVSHQGVAMGRASRIEIEIDGTPDQITGVRVGGEAVVVGRGELLV